jgi:hypothetical protein
MATHLPSLIWHKFCVLPNRVKISLFGRVKMALGVPVILREGKWRNYQASGMIVNARKVLGA